MQNKLSSTKTLFYILILVLGILVAIYKSSFDSVGPGTADQADQDENPGIIENERDNTDEFIESRSTAIYKLKADQTIDEIKRMFGLRLKREFILQYNPHLDQKKLEGKIPKGTQLRLFIQSRPNQTFLIKNHQPDQKLMKILK